MDEILQKRGLKDIEIQFDKAQLKLLTAGQRRALNHTSKFKGKYSYRLLPEVSKQDLPDKKEWLDLLEESRKKRNSRLLATK